MRHPMPSWIARPALAALAATGLAMAPAAAPVPARAADDVRPLSADRPDRTESPYTVPPGCLQLEGDLANHAELGAATAREAGAMNLKLGLHRAIDVQVVTTLYAFERVDGDALQPGARDHRWLPSLGLRLKGNLLGNDGGALAIGVLPYVEWPLESEAGKEATWGALVPVALALPGGLGFGAMAGGERMGDGRDALIASATVGRAIAPRLGAFVEGFAAWRWDAGPAEVLESTFDWGITCDVRPTVRLDLGACHGMSRDAEDLRVFAGGTWRWPR